MGSYVVLVGFDFIAGFDLASHGIKDWLQMVAALLAIGGSSYGAWKAFRYSKGQIAKRLLEYLEEHEKNVNRVRQLIVPYLRNGRTFERKPELEIHERVERAIKHIGRGEEQDAERELESFVLVLTQSAQVGERHMQIARRQAATIFVFAGLIAQRRGDIPSARSAWTKALEQNPQDPDNCCESNCI